MLATALFGVALAGTPILAQTVTIDYDHSVNFNKLQTYSWGKIHATDPSVEDRISIAANRDFRSKYMTEKSSGGDLTIVVVEATESKQEFVDFYAGLSGFSWQRAWGSGGFLDSPAKIQEVPLDTLILDMYDTKTHKLLWRGIVTEPMVKSVDKNDQKMDKAVTQLISKFPPKFLKTK
jgi:hypothetical protein